MAEEKVLGRRSRGEQFAYETLLVWIGVFVLCLGWLIFAPFTPGLQLALGPAGVWGIFGLFLIMGGFSTMGIVFRFRHKTRKFIADNQMFQLAFPQPLKVDVQTYPITDSDISTLSESEQEEARRIRLKTPGANSTGRLVRYDVYIPGGIDSDGFKSFYGGSQGLIITEGEGQVIQLQQCIYCPFTLKLVDHTTVPIEILTVAEKESYFVRGKSPIWRTGPLSPAVQSYIENDIVPNAIVLNKIGIPGLSDRYFARLRWFESQGHLPTPEGFKTPADFLNAVIDAIRADFNVWLEKQPGLKAAMGVNFADIEHYKGENYALRGQLTRAEARITVKDATIDQHEHGQHARAREAAGAWGGAPLPPERTLMNQRPSSSPYGNES